MKGRQSAPMGNDSVEEVLDAFKDFCRRRSKRAMNPNTLRRYEQVIDVQSKKYGFLLDRADLEHIERIVSERAKVLTPATYNTEMATLRRWCEFHCLDPRDRKASDILQVLGSQSQLDSGDTV